MVLIHYLAYGFASSNDTTLQSYTYINTSEVIVYYTLLRKLQCCLISYVVPEADIHFQLKYHIPPAHHGPLFTYHSPSLLCGCLLRTIPKTSPFLL